MWTVTPPMNECMGVFLKKMSLPTHKLDQEFENILKKNQKKRKEKETLHHHEQCLGLETLEIQ